VQIRRQEVVDVLRRAGLFEDAKWAAVSLPETTDYEELVSAAASRGINRDRLISLLGGSP
jgi:hypothetical protein